MHEEKKAVLKWLANGKTGVSSETLAFWATFGIKRDDRCHPLDPSDFNRCLNLLRAAPTLRLKLCKMSKISVKWARLVAHWDEIEKVFIEEVGVDWSKGRALPATKTYDLMQQVIKGKYPSAGPVTVDPKATR